MNKVYTRFLLLAAFFTTYFAVPVFAQTITIKSVDAGPYGQGSTITALVSVSGGACLQPGNVFRLYLVNSGGTETLITKGNFNSVYATYVNGEIPVTTPAGQYRLRVRTTSPAAASGFSNTFNINAVTGVSAKLTSTVINPASDPEVFGLCSGVANQSFTLTNQSTAGATVTADLTNELNTAENIAPISFNTTDKNFSAKLAHYTIYVKAVASNGTIGTKAYFLLNNKNGLNVFNTNDIEPACLPNGTITLTADMSSGSSRSLLNTFPGIIYSFNWGDQGAGAPPQKFTYCQLLALNGIITHQYTRSSCGQNITGPNGQVLYYNSFTLDISGESSSCSLVPQVVPVKVLSPGVANFTTDNLPVATTQFQGCTGNEITFDNRSYSGDNPNVSDPRCQNPDARYTWYVNGVSVPGYENVSISKEFKHIFAIAGTYNVKLVLISNSACQSGLPQNIREKTICIQDPPTASFNVGGQTGDITVCGTTNYQFQPTNTSVTPPGACLVNTYEWTITGPAAAQFRNNTNKNSPEPAFTLTAPGVYKLRLSIKNGHCDVLSAEQQITVNFPPVATLKDDPYVICNSTANVTFNAAAGPTQVILSGTGNPVADTYEWTAVRVSGTGANPTFVSGTNKNTKYPVIRFPGVGEYTVTITHKNSCNATGATDSQTIIVQDAPTAINTADIACPNTPVAIKSVITGTYASARWVSTGGGGFADATQLQTTYTPTAAEAIAGQAIVNMEITTTLPAPCNKIIEPLTITIKQPNPLTSELTKIVCSGNSLNYTITSALTPSTFRWEKDAAATSTFISGAPNSGTTSTINIGSLTNTDPANVVAKLVYIIYPKNGTCEGPGERLEISVLPSNPVVTFDVSSNTVCGTDPVTFTNNSPPQNGTYEWNFGDGTPNFVGYEPPPHVFQPNANGSQVVRTVVLTLINVNGCYPNAQGSKPVSVNPAKPVAIISVAQTSFCGSADITVENRSPGNNVEYDYYILDENKNEYDRKLGVTDKNPVSGFKILVSNPNRTIKYYVRMIAHGCNTTGQTVDDFPLTVSPSNLVSDMYFKNGITNACANSDVIFVNNSTGDEFTYTIYKDNVPFGAPVKSTTTELTYRFTEAGSYDVTITPKAGSTCTAAESQKRHIDIFAAPAASFTASVANCDNLNYSFAVDNPDNNMVYSWDFGDGSALQQGPNVTHPYVARSQEYTATLTVTNPGSGSCGVATTTRPVPVIPQLKAEFAVLPGEEIFVPNYHFSFKDNSTGNPVEWSWDMGNGTAPITTRNPEYTFKNTEIGPHIITLTIKDNKGCTSSKPITVYISGTPGALFVPNAFVPNNSSMVLQKFMAKGSGIKNWNMKIFNKWGQLVWETNKLGTDGEPLEGWDGTYKGTAAPQGAYIWQASAIFINGSEWKGMSYNNSPPKRTGVINLIR
jgi:PKD repeat protein